MLNNQQSENARKPNRCIFICGILFLSALLCITYIPGLTSISTKEWQPALITSNVWIDELDMTLHDGTDLFLDTEQMGEFDNLSEVLRLITMSVNFGWNRLYYIQGNEDDQVKQLIDRDLHIAGLVYAILSGTSLALFLIGMITMKKRYLASFFMMLSWLCLAVGVGYYIYNFYDSVIQDFIPDVENSFKDEISTVVNSLLDDFQDQINFDTGVLFDFTYDITNMDLGTQWRFASGLIGNVFALLLLPAINIMLCV